MADQKIKTKLTTKKKNLYNFSDDSDEEFNFNMQDEKMLPSSGSHSENKLKKIDSSHKWISENKFDHIKKEEVNNSITESDSYVQVTEVSIQTSLDNSGKFTEAVNTFEPLKENNDSLSGTNSDSFDEVAGFSLQFNLNCHNNECHSNTEGTIALPKNSSHCKAKSDLVGIVPLQSNFDTQNSSAVASNIANKLPSVADRDKYSSFHVETELAPNSTIQEKTLIAVVSNQTTFYKTNDTQDSRSEKKSFVSKDSRLSNNEVQTLISEVLQNNDSSEIYSSRDSGKRTENLKEIQMNTILAYDTDEEGACTENSHQATSLIIEETDSENDEPVEDQMLILTANNHNKCKVRTNKINNIVGKMEAMLITRSKKDGSSSDDDFESFLNTVKKSISAKDGKSKENTKPSLDDFIVDDSDIDYDSEEDSDELFYIKATNELMGKEEKYSYDWSFSSDDGLSSDSWNDENKRPTHTHLKNSDMGNLTSKAQEKSRDFLEPQCTPRISRKEKPKEKALENQSSICKKETILKDTHSNKDIDQDLLDENRHFLHSLSNDYPDFKRHSKAARYWKCFKETKLELAQHLHHIFNEIIFENQLPKDFKIDWNPRYTKTAGTFSYKGTSTHFTAQVTLSVKVCDSPERVRDTLAHELCHAAVKLINGVNEGHGPIWKSWAKKFNRKYPFMPVIVRCHDYIIKTKYTYQCTKCQYRIHRHSKSLDTDAKVCGHCRGKFEVFLTKDLERSTNSTATPRTPNKFALFVKECYSAKKKETGMRHGDVMKILSKEFAQKNSIHDQ